MTDRRNDDAQGTDQRAQAWAAALARSPVFAELSEQARLRLAARGAFVSLGAGERLCAAGDAADAAYVVTAGELEIVLARPDGGDVWLARAGVGDVVGDIALLDGGVRSADMTAVTNLRLLRLGREAVLEALAAEPAAALALLAHLARLLRETNRRVEAAAALDLDARLAQVLLSAPSGLTPKSQSEIARFVGAARESVNRRLARWRKAGMVAVTASGVRVLDAERLRAQAFAQDR
jgi:CRP-like cAMP-binding protein